MFTTVPADTYDMSAGTKLKATYRLTSVKFNAQTPTPNWRTLGELELQAGVNIDAAVHSWLVEILEHLNLSPDFLGRVLLSAQASVKLAIQPNTDGALSHVHISILVPHKLDRTSQSWGFFHTERLETTADGSDNSHHAIDFYLYVEGE